MKKSRGYTIIEILLVVSILSIMLTVLTSTLGVRQTEAHLKIAISEAKALSNAAQLKLVNDGTILAVTDSQNLNTSPFGGHYKLVRTPPAQVYVAFVAPIVRSHSSVPSNIRNLFAYDENNESVFTIAGNVRQLSRRAAVDKRTLYLER